MALNTTEALMSGFLKSSDIPHHHLAYGAAHSHHSSQLPPGMPMTMPFSLPHGLDGFGQGVWGNYCFLISPFFWQILNLSDDSKDIYILSVNLSDITVLFNTFPPI